MVMKDPLEELEESLAYMFELQTQKTGKYIDPAVQQLKNTIEKYKNNPSFSLQKLIRAMKLAIPVIERYVDLYTVKRKMEVLAESQGIEVFWEMPVIRKTYPQFQFGDVNVAIKSDFISWLSSRSGMDFTNLESHEQVQVLISASSDNEFDTKLTQHLADNPDFILNMIMKSSQIFLEVIDSSIGFQLENQQIAKAICHHHFNLINDKVDTHQQIEEYIDFLNESLAKVGCSIEKLLEDPLSKTELDKLGIFELYQGFDHKFTWQQ